MNGEFLRDLSSGVFSRLNSLRDEQSKKDQESKLQTIQLLSNLAGQVESDSLPTLMKFLGDTIGVKGKMKSFWNAFSNLPDRSIEDQLGTKFKEITSSVIGPTTATNIRAGGDLARLFQPQTPEQVTNQANRLQAESDLGNKMIFRDSRAEKIEDLKTQFGLKSAQQDELLQERERLLRQRQAEDDQRSFQNSWKINQQRAELKAHGDVLKRSSTLAFRDGFKIPTNDHLQQAAEEIANEQGLSVDLLKSRIGLVKAQIPLAEARTLKALRPPKAQRAGNDAAMGKAVEVFEKVKQALIDANARGDAAMTSTLRKRLQGLATNLSMKYGDKLEIGGGDWPYVKSKSSQTPMDIGQKPSSPISLSRQDAKARLMENGYSPEEADQELNRLGIK